MCLFVQIFVKLKDKIYVSSINIYQSYFFYFLDINFVIVKLRNKRKYYKNSLVFRFNYDIRIKGLLEVIYKRVFYFYFLYE